jgi:hypothetical protein
MIPLIVAEFIKRLSKLTASSISSISSLWFYRWSMAVAALLVVVSTANEVVSS